MKFNPLFISTVPGETALKTTKIANNNFLFADIINILYSSNSPKVQETTPVQGFSITESQAMSILQELTGKEIKQFMQPVNSNNITFTDNSNLLFNVNPDNIDITDIKIEEDATLEDVVSAKEGSEQLSLLNPELTDIDSAQLLNQELPFVANVLAPNNNTNPVTETTNEIVYQSDVDTDLKSLVSPNIKNVFSETTNLENQVINNTVPPVKHSKNEISSENNSVETKQNSNTEKILSDNVLKNFNTETKEGDTNALPEKQILSEEKAVVSEQKISAAVNNKSSENEFSPVNKSYSSENTDNIKSKTVINEQPAEINKQTGKQGGKNEESKKEATVINTPINEVKENVSQIKVNAPAIKEQVTEINGEPVKTKEKPAQQKYDSKTASTNIIPDSEVEVLVNDKGQTVKTISTETFIKQLHKVSNPESNIDEKVQIQFKVHKGYQFFKESDPVVEPVKLNTLKNLNTVQLSKENYSFSELKQQDKPFNISNSVNEHLLKTKEDGPVKTTDPFNLELLTKEPITVKNVNIQSGEPEVIKNIKVQSVEPAVVKNISTHAVEPSVIKSSDLQNEESANGKNVRMQSDKPVIANNVQPEADKSQITEKLNLRRNEFPIIEKENISVPGEFLFRLKNKNTSAEFNRSEEPISSKISDNQVLEQKTNLFSEDKDFSKKLIDKNVIKTPDVKSPELHKESEQNLRQVSESKSSELKTIEVPGEKNIKQEIENISVKKNTEHVSIEIPVEENSDQVRSKSPENKSVKQVLNQIPHSNEYEVQTTKENEKTEVKLADAPNKHQFNNSDSTGKEDLTRNNQDRKNFSSENHNDKTTKDFVVSDDKKFNNKPEAQPSLEMPNQDKKDLIKPVNNAFNENTHLNPIKHTDRNTQNPSEAVRKEKEVSPVHEKSFLRLENELTPNVPTKEVTHPEVITRAHAPERIIENPVKEIHISKTIAELKNIFSQTNESQVVTLKVNPEGLGHIKIDMVVNEKQVTTKIEVDSEAVKNIIQNNSSELKQSLNQNGMNLQSLNVLLNNEQSKQRQLFTKKSKVKGGDPEVQEQEITAKRIHNYSTYEYVA